MITSSGLDALLRVRHGFFTRRGGVSDGVFESLNCGFGSGDDRDAVSENRVRAVGLLTGGTEPLVTARQAHTPDAVVLEKAWRPEDSPVADALVTRTKGIVLGVLSADCAPVLIADDTAGVIAAVHAGWRGALAGVIEGAIAAMQKIGARASRMRAAVGPCIRQASYEVGPDLARAFTDADPGFDRYFQPAPTGDRLFFDLAAFAHHRLAAAGVAAVQVTEGDTFADPDRFFSYRRNQKSGEARYGRGLSAIVLLS